MQNFQSLNYSLIIDFKCCTDVQAVFEDTDRNAVDESKDQCLCRSISAVAFYLHNCSKDLNL